jgi:hypothetical protein
VVTIKVAHDAQLSLLAQRPQVSRNDSNTPSPIQVAHAEVEPDVRRAPNPAEAGAQDHGDDRGADLSRQDSRAELSGPSRARIVLRDFDVGKTPAEVVGTRDVVLRFDSNDDGRIDLIESQRSARARDDGASFRGLAAAASLSTPEPAPAPKPQAPVAG